MSLLATVLSQYSSSLLRLFVGTLEQLGGTLNDNA